MISIEEYLQKREELYDRVPKELKGFGKTFERVEWIKNNLEEKFYKLKAQLSDDDLRLLLEREIRL